MKKAGYENGMYNGPPLLTVADNESPAKETAEAFQEQVEKIGIKLQLREVPHATMLSKFCQVPKADVAICPNLGWGADFFCGAELHRPAVPRQEPRPVGQRQHRRGERPEAERRRSTRRSRSPIPGRRRRPGPTSTRR